MEGARDVVRTVTVPEPQYLFERVIDHIRLYHSGINIQKLQDAYDYALRAHTGQFRDSGEPYILHPVEVFEICAALNMDEESLITSLVHDVEEDTSYSLKDIERTFSKHVRDMVDSLTKISDTNFFVRLWNKKETKHQEETLRKLFVAMAKDPRVIVIKLADRLHALRTLEGLPKKKITRKCKETRDFFVPLARRLGLSSLYREMEDWCFYYLEPTEYRDLSERIKEPMELAESALAEMREELEDAFWLAGIPIAEIHSRKKHLASIHQKMQEKEIGLDEVYDLLAMRVVVDGPPQMCYLIMGEVHLNFPPVMHRFRDFISRPKTNGYQTLHTTVVGPKGLFVEVQIRNVEMHRQARYGIASHWMYKEHEVGPQYREDQEWNELIRMLQEENYDPQEFVARASSALLKDEVLVQTPKGEVISLPRGSTAIDFAYAIHTELGHAAGGAKINYKRVPLFQRLENGDVIEIVKREVVAPAPDPEWLEWAKSPRSLLKIRKWFRAQPRKRRIEIGKELLHKQIQRKGLYPLNLLAADKLVSILRLLKVGSIHDIYDGIALGDITTSDVLQKLKQVQMEIAMKLDTDSLTGRYKLDIPLIASGIELNIFDTKGRKTRLKMELSVCCRPMPGDEIVGYYPGEGKKLVVHKHQCSEVKQISELKRIFTLQWDPQGEPKHYPASIEIVCLNRAGLMYDVLGILAQRGINIVGNHFETSFSTSNDFDRTVYIELLIEVVDTERLNEVLDDIRSVPDVIAARRFGSSNVLTPMQQTNVSQTAQLEAVKSEKD